MPACQVHSESLTTGSNQEFTSDASGTLLYVSLLGICARTCAHTHTHTHTQTPHCEKITYDFPPQIVKYTIQHLGVPTL